MKNNKNVYIIAGPNGSGKTTFASKFLRGWWNGRHDSLRGCWVYNPWGFKSPPAHNLISRLEQKGSLKGPIKCFAFYRTSPIQSWLYQDCVGKDDFSLQE